MGLQAIVHKIMRQFRVGTTKDSSRSLLSFLFPRSSPHMRRSDTSLVDIIKRGEFGSISDEDAVRYFSNQFGPELKRLQNAAATIESGEAHPKGSLGERDLTPSRFLFGLDYAEVNRTLVSFLALKWLVANDYKSFTAHQSPAVKLKPESFRDFYDLAMQTLSDPNQLLALVVSIVVGDLGKDPDLAEDVKARGGKLAANDNHDEVVYIAAALDVLAPLKLLPPDLKEDVVAGLNVGSKLNIPQLAQAENVPGSLQSALLLRGHERAFAIKYLEIMFDVAGAGGHDDARAAIRMIEPVYQAFTVGRRALLDIITGKTSLHAGYDQVLQHRSQLLQGEGFTRLSTTVADHRALLRILAMGRVADNAVAKMFARAFDTLPEAIRESLVNGLSVDGYEDGEAIILYYMPALFAEALRSTKNAPDATKVEALSSLMRFMARVYGGSRPHQGRKGSIVERDVSVAQETVRSDAFKADPGVLDSLDIPFS